MNNNSDFFEYPVLSDEEMEAMKKRLEPAEYIFQVEGAENKISKSGNPMIELIITVWDDDGKTYKIWDWLIGTKNMFWKTKHFWESVGEPEKCTGKTFIADFYNKSGKVKTGLRPDDKGNQKPFIIDYVGNPVKNISLHPEVPFDDDIAF